MPIIDLLDPSKYVTEPEQKARLDICANCHRKGRRFGKDICTLCGCFLDLKTKLKTEECPLSKWKKSI